jgi:hypothetical protein
MDIPTGTNNNKGWQSLLESYAQETNVCVGIQGSASQPDAEKWKLILIV